MVSDHEADRIEKMHSNADVMSTLFRDTKHISRTRLYIIDWMYTTAFTQVHFSGISLQVPTRHPYPRRDATIGKDRVSTAAYNQAERG